MNANTDANTEARGDPGRLRGNVMNDQELEALVAERVEAELAKRDSAERVSEVSKELQAKQNQELDALVASARQEPTAAYGTGRDFSRGRELARKEGVLSAAGAIALEVEEELRGTRWELNNG